MHDVFYACMCTIGFMQEMKKHHDIACANAVFGESKQTLRVLQAYMRTCMHTYARYI
jgi:hypothetical protein